MNADRCWSPSSMPGSWGGGSASEPAGSGRATAGRGSWSTRSSPTAPPRLFVLHIVVVWADLFVIGPLAIAHKSTLWYWGGRIALLSASLPLATYLNGNPQSFGTLIGRWVVLRNFFEYGLHVVFAAMAVSWFRYCLLLWWPWPTAISTSGPAGSSSGYDTPEKRAARPWAPVLNWAVITALYVLTFLAVYHRGIRFADVPGDDVATYVPQRWEIGVVVGVNVALVLATWS